MSLPITAYTETITGSKTLTAAMLENGCYIRCNNTGADALITLPTCGSLLTKIPEGKAVPLIIQTTNGTNSVGIAAFPTEVGADLSYLSPSVKPIAGSFICTAADSDGLVQALAVRVYLIGVQNQRVYISDIAQYVPLAFTTTFLA